MNVIELEQPEGVIATLGGQTAINLAAAAAQPRRNHHRHGLRRHRAARRTGTPLNGCLQALAIPRPQGRAVTTIEEGVRAAAEIGYPVLVRPSFVLGGRAMQIVAKRGAAPPLSENRRGDRRGQAGAGRPLCTRQGGRGGRGLRRRARVRPRHYGACGAHRRSFGRFHQRVSRPSAFRKR